MQDQSPSRTDSANQLAPLVDFVKWQSVRLVVDEVAAWPGPWMLEDAVAAIAAGMDASDQPAMHVRDDELPIIRRLLTSAIARRAVSA